MLVPVGTWSHPEILVWSLELERTLQPWCPNDCREAVPFTAKYSSGEKELVFVAVKHAFTPRNLTIDAVDAGFRLISPKVVIVEGFPTQMGENPKPLIDQAAQRGTPEADDFTKGEAMHAISLAIARGLPFVGGEPTRAQEVDGLRKRGYSDSEIVFGYLLSSLTQSMNANDITDLQNPQVVELFDEWRRVLAREYKVEPLTFDNFKTRYRETFKVDLYEDAQFRERSETQTGRLATMNQAGMMIRDQHLLDAIEAQLKIRTKVLVVYGGSHWTTLSRALEAMLGRPTIRPYVSKG